MMVRTNKLLIPALLLSIFTVGGVHAELSATPLPGDSRLVQFEYDSDQTFLILSRPKAVTDIEFAADEKIMTVAGGDTKNWELTPTANKKHLFVKPVYDNTETSMTVLTDKRSYQFVLKSTTAGAKWYQRVTWRHGQTVLLDLNAVESDKAVAVTDANIATRGDSVNPKNLRFGFQIAGDADFKPVAIYDDGKRTWIQMPPGLQELPALFGMADGDEFQLVNSIIDGDYIVAQRVLNSGILKLGKAEVRFVRGANLNASPRRTAGE